jgi:hypothetical protein
MNDYVYFEVNSDQLSWQSYSTPGNFTQLVRNKIYKADSSLFARKQLWSQALIFLSNVDVLVETNGHLELIEELI